MNICKQLALASCVSLLCAQAPTTGASQDRPERDIGELITDRPDFTESTEVVGAGVFQFENGFTLDKDRLAGIHSLSAGELLMRVGISKRVELRFGGAGYLLEKARGNPRDHGYSDSEVGLKIKIFDERKWSPAFSIIPIMSMATGSRYFSSLGYEPTVKLCWAKDLPKEFALSGNVNFGSYRDVTGRFFQNSTSVSIGHELLWGWAGYSEVYTFAPFERDGGNAWIHNAGLTHSIGKHAQFDVRAGKRMTGVGPNWFFGVGMAFRQPTNLFLR